MQSVYHLMVHFVDAPSFYCWFKNPSLLCRCKLAGSNNFVWPSQICCECRITTQLTQVWLTPDETCRRFPNRVSAEALVLSSLDCYLQLQWWQVYHKVQHVFLYPFLDLRHDTCFFHLSLFLSHWFFSLKLFTGKKKLDENFLKSLNNWMIFTAGNCMDRSKRVWSINTWTETSFQFSSPQRWLQKKRNSF